MHDPRCPANELRYTAEFRQDQLILGGASSLERELWAEQPALNENLGGATSLERASREQEGRSASRKRRIFPHPQLYPEINYVTTRRSLNELKEGSEVK